MDQIQSKSSSLQKVVRINFILALVVVTLGALTRLLDAGLGCPDWPGCYGYIVPPQTEAQLSQASALFPETPVEAGKAWMEMIHRYFASLLGFLILVQCFLTFKSKQTSHLKKVSVFLSVWVIIQGLFGMWTVTMNVWPQIVTAHLAGGFITVIGLFYFERKLTTDDRSLLASSPFRKWMIALGAILILQILLGGWTSTTYSGLACPDFPTCQNQWLPELSLGTAYEFNDYGNGEINFLGGVKSMQDRVTIQVVHRIFAVLLLALTLFVTYRLWQMGYRGHAMLLSGAVLLQALIGILNAVLLLPLVLALLHNSGALLVALVYTQIVVKTKYVTVIKKEEEAEYESKYS